MATADAGLLNIIRRLKSELTRRGATGIIGIARKFRIMDDDGNKALSMGEFKKAMKECSFDLNDAELRALFNFFDSDHSGTIDYDEFLNHVRDPMNERRLELVRSAFVRMDKDGSGTLEPNDLMDRFNATKHPEVIAGRKTADDIFREFLETFDVGGEKDGLVTMQEWINYYNNVSASIDNDDYFELMIRNAWHISGGTGTSANTSNRRVLVTRADGRQTVEEIKDDLGVSANDTTEIQRRLSRQGVSVARLSLTDSVDNTVPASNVRRPAAGGSAVMGSGSSVTPRSSTTETLRGGGVASVLKPGVASTSAAPRPRTAAGVSPLAPAASAGLQSIVRNLKAELLRRGARGIVGIARKFRIMDDDGSKTLSMAEFKKAMKEEQLSLSETELRLLFDYFDKDHSGTIDFEEFLNGVRDPMNERRLALARQAFAIMDKNGDGTVDANDLVDRYDASKHPDVLAGRKTADDVYREFLDTFDVGGEKDGVVTMQEWINYYNHISASIDDDDYFELMMRNAWHISGGTGWTENSSNRRVLVTHSDGRQTVEEIKNDLGVKANDTAEMQRRLARQGVNASKVSTFDGGDDGVAANGRRMIGGASLAEQVVAQRSAAGVASRPSTFETLRGGGVASALNGQSSDAVPSLPSRPPSRAGAGGVNAGGAQAPAFSKVDTNRGGGVASILAAHVAPVNSAPTEAAPARPKISAGVPLADAAGGERDVNVILERLKFIFKRRGAVGLAGLARRFKIMDDNNNCVLEFSEFLKAMREVGIVLTDGELRRLFRHFDCDNSGGINYEEFLDGIRDPMNDRRRALAQLAFKVIDKNGSGNLDPSDLMDRYDASKHPDVLAGRKTADDVYREFLDTFDVGGEKDGVVTMQEWINYYNHISASIDDDDYFELMMRNAWHISGGTGWTENSSNRRVLVTHSDGRQTVEEIKNDLGVKANDTAEMQRRLARQGVNASKVSTFDGGDDGAGESSGASAGARRAPVSLADRLGPRSSQVRFDNGAPASALNPNYPPPPPPGPTARNFRTSPTFSSSITFG